MPVFQYQGRDKAGKRKNGNIKADNRKEAIVKVREKGIAITKIEQLTGILYREIEFGQKKVKFKDFILYLRQFSTLLKAGVSLVESTRTLAQQTSNKILKKTLYELVEVLEEGRPYSEGAEKYRHVFPPLFVNMMRAGEAGGNMDEILDRMATYYEKQYSTKQKVKSALAYPVTVGIIAVIVVIFLLSTIVPTFASMFASMGGELPFITSWVMNAGDFVQSYWWLFVLFGIGIFVGFRFVRSKRETKYYLDYVLLKIPVIGGLLLKAELAKLTRTLSSLFASSVPILQSLTIVERVLDNEVVRRVIGESRSYIETGHSLAVPMEKHWAFPPMVTQMITIGESSGTLDMMLDKIADFYEMEVEHATEQMKSLLEPMMIVFLAVSVGTIVAAIAIPMFKIFETIQ